MRRFFLLCAVIGCGSFARPVGAQTPGGAGRIGTETHYHFDDYDPVPAPAKVNDRALADLLPKLSKVRLNSGPLDTEDLTKVLRDALQGLKPPGKLGLRSSASCQVVDPQDRGGYWTAPSMMFRLAGDDYAWRKNLEVDWKKFGLFNAPVAELKYVMVRKASFEENTNERPFRRTVHLAAEYSIRVTVTVVFDPQVVAEGTGGSFSGTASGSPESPTLQTTVALTDGTKF